MNEDAINIHSSLQEVSIECENLVDNYRKLSDMVEEWSTLVRAGLATDRDYLFFLVKSTEVQEEMRESVGTLGWAVEAFRNGLEDSGLSY